MRVLQVPTKSRNVKRYVRAVWRARELAEQLDSAHAAKILAEGALTGAQRAEARRILDGTPRPVRGMAHAGSDVLASGSD